MNMNLYKSLALIGIGYMIHDRQTKPSYQRYSYQSNYHDLNSVSRHLKQILNDKLDLMFYGNCEWRPAMKCRSRDRSTLPRYYPVTNKASRFGSTNGSSVIKRAYLDSRESADDLLFDLRMYIDRYGSVALGDYYELYNTITRTNTFVPTYTDYQYVWRSLDSARVEKAFDGTEFGWYLELPEPKLETTENTFFRDSAFESDDEDGPFEITEETYNTDNLSWGKKTIFVYDDVCTFSIILRTIDDEEMEGYVGKLLLEEARRMGPEEKMYVRNPEIETDIELIRVEGNHNK